LNVGPGARFTVSFSVGLNAEGTLLCLLLQSANMPDASHGHEQENDTKEPSENLAKKGRRRSVAILARRLAHCVAVELRVSGRLCGKRAEINLSDATRCNLCVEYIEGCVVVYAVSRPFEACHEAIGGACTTLLVETVDVSTQLGGDEATLSMSSGKAEGGASVLTHWHVCTGHAHTVQGQFPASTSLDDATTEPEPLTNVLSALSNVAHMDAVRGELDGAVWQDLLWSLCRESRVDEESRGIALVLALGGLQQPNKQVQVQSLICVLVCVVVLWCACFKCMLGCVYVRVI
jgi:hypothetical protein